MAIYNEMMSGRFNRSLQKIFGIKGPPPVRQLGGEVMPVHMVASGVEHRYLEGWNRFAAMINAGPTVGQNNGFQIKNPGLTQLSGSNKSGQMILVIESLVLRNEGGTDTFIVSQFGNAVADLLNVFTGFRLDPRGNPTSSAVLSSASNVVSPAVEIYRRFVQANTDLQIIQFEDQEQPLLPGEALRIVGAQLNIAQRVGFIWRER